MPPPSGLHTQAASPPTHRPGGEEADLLRAQNERLLQLTLSQERVIETQRHQARQLADTLHRRVKALEKVGLWGWLVGRVGMNRGEGGGDGLASLRRELRVCFLWRAGALRDPHTCTSLHPFLCSTTCSRV